MIRHLFNGFCMALADSVPGVSGGTIAFILGFYDKFIGSINDLGFGNKEKKIEALTYLVKLGIGWAIGMISSILVIASAFETHIYSISSLFMGFIIASIPLVISEEIKAVKESYMNIIFMIFGIVVVVGLSLLNGSSFMGDINLSALTIPSAIFLFVSGMVAISAMFLPGISGSTILLILGIYVPVITGIKEILHFNFSYFTALVVFGLGILTGMLSVVKGIKYCLENHRSKTIYAIIGLMIGSLYSIIVGPTTLEVPADALSFSNFDWIFCIIGISLVVLLKVLGTKKEQK